MKKTKVGLLMGGVSEEGYLSLRSAEQIFNNYDRNKYSFKCIEWKPDGAWVEYAYDSFTDKLKSHSSMVDALAKLDVDIVFVAFHGDKEGNGKLAGFMEMIGLPYTGNGFFTSFVGMNKYTSKLIFMEIGLKTPDFIRVMESDKETLPEMKNHIISRLGLPLVAKPVSSGSSVGIKIINNEDELGLLPGLIDKYGPMLLEEYIKGRELSVGVYGSYRGGDVKALPAAEIKYPDEIFDEQCKYDDTYEVIVPADISNDTEQKVSATAIMIHKKMMFEGLSRTDVIEKDGELYVLEVNTHPGLGGHSIFPAMMKAADVTYSKLIDVLVHCGLERHECQESLSKLEEDR